MIDCIEFVGNVQGVCIGFAFMSKLVGNGGKDTGLGSSFRELSRAEKVSAQDRVLFSIITLLESFGHGIRNGCFPGASLTGQPEDTRAGQ